MHVQRTSVALILSILLLVSGCASSNNPNDPLERFNRATFSFNDKLDKAILKPVAKGYNTLPKPARTGIHNAFNNLDDFTVLINDTLQGNFDLAARSTWRFVVNSTVGLFGLIDVAGYLGLEKHDNDFGITLARWGASVGTPYIVWPFLGPSTIRSTVGKTVDWSVFSIMRRIYPIRLRNQLLALNYIDTRATLLHDDKTISAASFDPYVFQRNAFLQHRSYLLEQLTGKPLNLQFNDYVLDGDDDLYLLDDEELNLDR